MSKDIERLAGFNPYTDEAGHQWAISEEGRRVFEHVVEGGDVMLVGGSASDGRKPRIWMIAGVAAAVTLAAFVPTVLFRQGIGGVGGPVASTQPTTTTSMPLPPSAPSAELLAYLLPISGAETASVNYIGRAGTQEQFDRVAACLRSEGFDLDFQSSIPPDFISIGRNYILPYDSLRKYGFAASWTSQAPGLSPGESYVQSLNDALAGLIPLPDGVPEAEARALVDAHQQCLTVEGEGQETLLRRFDQDYELLAGNFEVLVREMDESNPAIVDALRGFRNCVEDRGWSLRMTRDDGSEIVDPLGPFLGEVQRAVFSVDNPEVQRETDNRAVTDLIECIAPVEAVRHDLRAELRDGYVEDYWVDLIEAEARFGAALRELGIGAES